MYYMANSGSVFLFFVFFPSPPSIIFIFDSFTLVFGHLCILQRAVAKSGCLLMSREHAGDGGVECACLA